MYGQISLPKSEVLVSGPGVAEEGPRHVRRGTLGAEAEGLRDVRSEHASFFQTVERQPRLVVYLFLAWSAGELSNLCRNIQNDLSSVCTYVPGMYVCMYVCMYVYI